MSDQPPPKDATTRARQGETTGVVRWVLGISLTLVIVGMVTAFVLFAKERVGGRHRVLAAPSWSTVVQNARRATLRFGME